MKRTVLLPLICAIILLAGCQPLIRRGKASLEERIQRVENGLLVNRSIQERMDAHAVPGLSIAVIADYELEWSRSYGVMELGQTQPVTAETLFQAGSVAKPVTAVTALHYVESGLLDLDQDVNEVLTSWQIPENQFTALAPVTLRGLLSHTAGINQGLNRGYAPGEEVPTLLQALEGVPPANTLPVRVDRLPGSESYYSNGGYLVVVQLLEDALGKPFQEITRETLFGPLGMESSTFEQRLPAELAVRAATPHGWDTVTWGEAPGLIGEIHTHDPGYGGLWTTAEDLARFGRELMLSCQGRSSQVLSQEMTRQIMEPVFEGVPMQAPYDVDIGLGFDLLHLGGETWLIHFGGSFPGYISVLLLQPASGFGVAILTNSFTGYELIWETLYSLLYAYGFLPTAGQMLVIGFSALLFLAAGANLIQSWVKSRTKQEIPRGERLEKAGSGARQVWGIRLFLFALAASSFAIALRFQGPWGGFQVHPLWKGASWPTKLLLGSYFTSGIPLLVFTIQVWTKRLWSSRDRIFTTLLALGILGAMFALRNLWDVMFWG